MKMKRDNMKWAAMPIATLCLTLAAGCSSDDAAETPATTRPFTINASLGTDNANAGTRAGVIPDNNTDQTKEFFIWHEKDEFTTWMMTDEAGSNFNGTTYQFAIDDDKYTTPSNSASFECTTDFPTENVGYKMVGTYPTGIFSIQSHSSLPILKCSIKSTQVQAVAKSTSHLSNYMAMYAIATVGDGKTPTSLKFQHLTSLFRFTVTNNTASTCKITKIEVSSDTEVFGYGWALMFSGGEMEKEAIGLGHKLILGLGEETNGNYTGLELKANEPFNAYAVTGPSIDKFPLTGKILTFAITVTDTDGNNLRTYTRTLDANDIIGNNSGATTWEAGKRYWFDLDLNKMLNVKLNSVDNLPGWDNETEIK